MMVEVAKFRSRKKREMGFVNEKRLIIIIYER